MILDIFKTLNWAQIGLTLCSLGVVFFTFMTTFVQQQESKQKDQIATKLNQELLQLAQDNKRLSEEIKSENQTQFEISASPDPRLESVNISQDAFIISIKNYGQNTAENLQLEWNYSYAPKIMMTQRELPPGEICTFTGQIFPLGHIPAMQKAYADTVSKFKAGKIALIIRLKVSYGWNEKNFELPEYTLIWDGKKPIVY